MSQDMQMSVAEMKAERKRLATARGLLTRERNKLAAEREQLQALAQEVELQRADRGQKVESARDELRSPEAAATDVLTKLEDMEAKLEKRNAELAEAQSEAKTLRKKAFRAVRKKAKRYVAKKAHKKLAKAYAKIQKLEKALRVAQASIKPPP